MWGVSHCCNCHFINPDLVLPCLIPAVKYWMTLILQVETLRMLGKMELGYNVPLQTVLQEVVDRAPGGWGRSQQQTCSSKAACFQPKKEFVPGVRGLAEGELSNWGGGADRHLLPARGPLFSPFPSWGSSWGNGGSLRSLINLGREPAPCCGSPDAPLS